MAPTTPRQCAGNYFVEDAVAGLAPVDPPSLATTAEVFRLKSICNALKDKYSKRLPIRYMLADERNSCNSGFETEIQPLPPPLRSWFARGYYMQQQHRRPVNRTALR